MPDLRDTLRTCLQDLAVSPLREGAIDLLAALGYRSDRTVDLGGSSPDTFLTFLEESSPEASFDRAKALFTDWSSADLLFQLTDEELGGQASLFNETDIQPGLLQSYVFFAIKLNGKSAINGSYARGKLTATARQINRVFPMPVMVLIQHPDQGREVLSIAVINRRANKREQHKDVLGKVTIIRDISLADPHRGHLDILDSFAFPNLRHPEKLPITNFDTLHAAWEEIFNVELLNKRFYKELANWYFWALPQVDFPTDLEPDGEKRRATGLIRLLTRLIFCWFIKEKGLIPEKLFHRADLADILQDFDPESRDSSQYYQAVLQNLFFATLNQRMGKDSKGEPFRHFVPDEGFQKNRKNHDLNNYYRYEALFAGSQEDALAHFADIPFLNGGLFECLDRRDEEQSKTYYLDGFSRNAKKRPSVPNYLFFADEIKGIDLSDVYHDNRRKTESVSGLIRILNRYKFTIVENTPIDQEIALDPELLGKVFENLLASYNEETKTTARKQTGSFYTPRPIVDYMVDESLKAHLLKALTAEAGMSSEDAQTGLDILFAYTEREHAFTDREKDVLIRAIDRCKILDPACGSGAFPMGILHKLVFILGKLDPGNERWKQTQLNKLDSAPMREELERTFEDNDDDYGRKLYLIENCLYGVDIQPIAIQISKLRFFISLICDQKTNRSKKDNHGIRPLPNLETKFVAADTLIGLPEMDQSLLIDPRVDQIEKEIASLYHRHFGMPRRDQKLALQRKIKDLRKELGSILAESLMAPAKAQHVASWDPFDPQASSDFFDPFWMFGIFAGKRTRKSAGTIAGNFSGIIDDELTASTTESDGFDIVIGNPPYVSVEKFANTPIQKKWKQHFETYAARGDIYCFFYERALGLLRREGVLCYITSNKFQKAGYGKKLRKLLASQHVHIIIDFCELPVFAAATDPLIIVCSKQPSPGVYEFPVLIVKDQSELRDLTNLVASRSTRFEPEQLRQEPWSLKLGHDGSVVDKMRSTGQPLNEYVDGKLYLGLRTGLNEAFVINAETKKRLIDEDKKSEDLIRPWIRGRDITRWKYVFNELYVITIPHGFHQQLDNYPAIRRHLEKFELKLKARGQCISSRSGSGTGQHHWLELDNNPSADFLNLFATPSVVYADIGKHFKAFFNTEGIYFGNTAYFIPESGPWLAAILLSRPMDFYYRHSMQPLGDPWTTGRMRFFSRSMNLVPIPPINSADRIKLTKLAERAAEAARIGKVEEINRAEREIDKTVCRLFDFNVDEIAQIDRALSDTRGSPFSNVC